MQKGEEPPKPEPDQKEPEIVIHMVKRGETLSKIAPKYGISNWEELQVYNELPDHNIRKGQALKIPPKKEESTPQEEEKDTKTITYYQKIDSASLGSEVYLTAETQNLEGKTVSFKVFEKESVLLTEKDAPIPLLVNKEEKTEVEAKVNDGKAQIAVILKRKDKDAHQQWKDILSPPEECIDGVWYDTKKDQDVKMKVDDKRILAEPDRYTPAIKHQEKKKTYLWLQVTCEGEQLDFDQPFLKKSGALEVDYSDRAPWMVFAIEEAKKAKGASEDEEPLHQMVVGYHSYVGLKDDPDTSEIENAPDDVPWCASFVSWILNRAQIKNPKTAGSQVYIDHSTLKKLEQPIFGAIAVFSNYKINGTYKGQGHVSFVYGKDKNENFICLGGNQGNKLKFSPYKKINKYKRFEQRLRGLYVPKDYNIISSDTLKEYNLNELNKSLTIDKKTEENESTR